MGMKLMNILFFALLATLAMAIASAANVDDDYNLEEVEMQSSNEAALPAMADVEDEADETTTSLRGVSRFLSQKPVPSYTCNNFPRTCRAKNSPGPDCCKKKCVNVKSDRYNCGKCGRRCKYTEICCKGKCINASFDKRHCGACNKKCNKGEYCVYGMCSYA